MRAALRGAAGASLLLVTLAALLLLAQTALYLWMAPRGFEFTDEAYYLLNLLHWRDFQGNVTFFAAYFELPFRALGQNVAAVRVFSLVLLLACAAYCTSGVLHHLAARALTLDPLLKVVCVMAGMAGAMLYFSRLSTLRVPSYNLGALCAALVATGLLLGMLSASCERRARYWKMFGYGVAVGMCGLNKPTSGLALVFVQALFVFMVARPWLREHGVQCVVLALVGVAANAAGLFLMAPHWLDQLREGLALVSLTDGRGILGLGNLARFHLQEVILENLHWGVLSAAAYLGSLWAARRWGIRLAGVPDLLLVAASAYLLSIFGDDSLWWPIVVWACLLLMVGTERRWTDQGQGAIGQRGRAWALVLLLLSMPLVMSFGTNMPVLVHAKVNAVFAVLALVAVLVHARGARVLSRPVMLLALALLCVPGLAFQWRAATEPGNAYRQLQPLAMQDVPVQLNHAPGSLLVDAQTAQALQAVRATLLAAGWTPGSPVIDFTGDGPGWVYAMDGQPVGVAWLLGGYPGSEATVARVLQGQSRELLRRSWLLVSDINPRRIQNWHSLLKSRIGDQSHELAGTVMLIPPYRWAKDAPTRADLQLWRPANSVSKAASQGLENSP